MISEAPTMSCALDPNELLALLEEDISSLNGVFLYSDVTTLKKGDIYLLGTNPGGYPSKEGISLAKDILNLPEKSQNNYLDEKWRHHKGQMLDSTESKLVKRLIELFKNLNPKYCLRDICSSNLVFVRSRNLNDMPLETFNDYAKSCWRIHEMVIGMVKPKMLIVFGNGEGKYAKSPYRFLKEKYFKGSESCYPKDKGTRIKWFSTRINDHPVTILGLPHLSRFTVSDDAMRKIKAVFQSL